MVIIRAPREVVVSFHIRSPWILLSQGLTGYWSYYGMLMPIGVQVVVAEFSSVIADFGEIIVETNRRHNCQFEEFEHTDSNITVIFSRLEAGSRKRYGDQYLKNQPPD